MIFIKGAGRRESDDWDFNTKVHRVGKGEIYIEETSLDGGAVSSSSLYKLLHNSTLNEDEPLYAWCVELINWGDPLDKWDVYLTLIVSQRDPFYEYEVLGVKDINNRLDYVMSNSRL